MEDGVCVVGEEVVSIQIQNWFFSEYAEGQSGSDEEPDVNIIGYHAK